MLETEVVEGAKCLGLYVPSEYVYSSKGQAYEYFKSYVSIDKTWCNDMHNFVEVKMI